MSNTQSQASVDWENLSDEDLLGMRIRHLGLQIEGTQLEERIRCLYDELDSRGIAYHPPCYLADEWFCPNCVPIIGIPFFLAHPRLSQLEKKMMLEVEGGTPDWCMKLLRHETGHALNYAYRLYKRTRWRELFGPFSARYSYNYSTAPYSRRYVIHLEDNYAQAHPDEDFAETFAVWLTPDSTWKTKYQRWPALKKLHYVDHLFQSIGSQAPLVTTHQTPWSAARMKSTLAAYYERKRRYLGNDFLGFYDPGLEKIFIKKPLGEKSEKASRFLRMYRRQIVNSIAAWTGQRKYDIDKLIRKLCLRCEDLGLALKRSEKDTIFEITAFITASMSKIHRFRKGKTDT